MVQQSQGVAYATAREKPIFTQQTAGPAVAMCRGWRSRQPCTVGYIRQALKNIHPLGIPDVAELPGLQRLEQTRQKCGAELKA